ncbi:Uncharacterized protein APZ42_009031 [Daphnia magna]|uniref:Uncharacterized protein n=1 Tax=Daphnia magna TaxID=35525 RepID=A0A164E970_9CRUS|nr:Uncharacterized protein APZ42_009031 [Daphnia magna]
MSLTSDKRTNGKWTIGYPMDVLWTMCASRVGFKLITSPPKETGNIVT